MATILSTPELRRRNHPKNHKDGTDIIANLLLTISKQGFCIRSDIARNYKGSISNGQLKRYLPLLEDHGMIKRLIHDKDYTCHKGRVYFTDSRLQKTFLNSSSKMYARKHAELMVVTEKGLHFLDVYNKLSRLLVFPN